MKRILLSLLLAGTVQNSFVMQAACGGGQAAESSSIVERQVPVVFKDRLMVYLDLQRLKVLNSGLLKSMLFTPNGLSCFKELSESNPFVMKVFSNLENFEQFEKILKGQLSGEIAEMVKFIEDANFLDINFAQHLRELKERDLQKFFALCTALLANKIDFKKIQKEPKIVKQDFTILLEKVFPDLLVEAIKSNEFEAAKMLIAAGFNVNASNSDGDTAMMLAAANGHTEIARLLIVSGANIDNKDSIGRTELMLVSRNGHREIAQLLIAAGADVNSKANYTLLTALIYATENGHKEIAQLLINAGADVNSKANYNLLTALIYATEKGHKEIAQLLINAGADVNDLYKFDYSALMRSAYWGQTSMVKLLIEAGANVNYVNKNGETALTLALKKGHTDIAKLLIDYGAKSSAYLIFKIKHPNLYKAAVIGTEAAVVAVIAAVGLKLWQGTTKPTTH